MKGRATFSVSLFLASGFIAPSLEAQTTAPRETIACAFLKSRMDDKANILPVEDRSPPPLMLAVNYALTPSGEADLKGVRRSDPARLLGDAEIREIPIQADGRIALFAGSQEQGVDTYTLVSFASGGRVGRVETGLFRMKKDKGYDLNSHVFRGRCQTFKDDGGALFGAFEKKAELQQ